MEATKPSQQITHLHVLSVATFWAFIRAIDELEPGLVVMIANFVSDDYVSPYCLVHIDEEEKEKDSRGFDCEQTILTLVFKSKVPLFKYNFIVITICQDFRAVEYGDTGGEETLEIKQHNLIFKEECSIQQKETISCKTPIQLIISKEHIKDVLSYGYSYYDTYGDIKVFEMGQGKYDFVQVTDERYFKQYDEEDFK